MPMNQGKKLKWYKFDQKKGSRQKRPPERKWVLVFLPSREPGTPESIAVGYMKNAAGDKQCPYFVTPGLGGNPVAWCDCLPEFPNPWTVDYLKDVRRPDGW
jgi:hypothetical protein